MIEEFCIDKFFSTVDLALCNISNGNIYGQNWVGSSRVHCDPQLDPIEILANKNKKY